MLMLSMLIAPFVSISIGSILLFQNILFDRYLSCTLQRPGTDAQRLRLALHSNRKGNPICLLSPHVKAQHPKRFLVAPNSFCWNAADARLTKQRGKLALLAAERIDFLSGLRMVDKIQLEIPAAPMPETVNHQTRIS